MLTDIEEPVAFDRTPLTAAVAGAVGPRTPFSPERTFVTLPGPAYREPWDRTISRSIREAGRDNAALGKNVWLYMQELHRICM